MKRIFTFYVLLIGLLVSQDAFRLLVKNSIVSNEKLKYANSLAQIDNSEESEDNVEDSSEAQEDAIPSSFHTLISPVFVEKSTVKTWQLCVNMHKVYLEQLTPPPQV